MARNPLQAWNTDTSNPLGDAPSYPPEMAADDGGMVGRFLRRNVVDPVGEWLAKKHKEAADAGLWTGGEVWQGGRPTRAGVMDALHQTAEGVAMGTTSSGGGGPKPEFPIMYHGSPHKFPPTPRNPLGEFDPAKIGTGEGAQAYGVGAGYLAEREGIARGYKDQLSPTTDAVSRLIEKHHGDATAAMTEGLNSGGLTAAEFDALRAYEKTGQLPPRGHMYEVRVHADPERFLHWDKPLSEQHPDVQKAVADRFDLRPGGVKERAEYLASLPNDELRAVATKALDNRSILGDAPEFARLMKEAPDIDHNAVWDIQRASLHPEGWGSYNSQPTTMGDLYRGNYFGEPADASAALREAGIPGIRYLDQGSRGAGEGTHNAVVFDAATMEIIRRYGLAAFMAGGGAAAAQQQPNALVAP